jgi:hypothetical protein
MARSRIVVLAAALLALPAFGVIAPQPAQAQGTPRWEILDTHTVSAGKSDVDTFSVGARKGDYTAIKIRVENAPCVITDVKVYFADGGAPYSPNVRLVFDANTNSREIDLPGKARDISRVVMRYTDIKDGKVPRVELWGKDVSGPAAAPANNAVKLGEHPVSGSKDTDTFEVDGSGGQFDGIAIKAEADNVRIYNVVVKMTNGEVLTLTADFTLSRNQVRYIDLPGQKRAIRTVTFKYGNIGPSQNARLELWGRR